MIGTLGQFVREIRDLLSGSGDPIPVNIGGANVTIDGDVTISNEVEIKNDDGNPIPVSDGGGSLTVDGPLTDTQLRAASVPVTGPITDAQLRATAVPVSGTVNTLTGLSIPPHDKAVLDPPAQPTTVTYYLDDVFVAQVGLSYDEGDNLQEVTVTYVDPEA